jgi:hypothetical protein
VAYKRPRKSRAIPKYPQEYQKISKLLAIWAAENTELHIKIPKHFKIYQNQTYWISGTVGDNNA